MLGEAVPVVPPRLVKRILKPTYVDMADLLKDNMEVERHRALLELGTNYPATRVTRREIPDVQSWLQSFSLFAAVICSKFPQKSRELFAYQCFIVGEARLPLDSR